MLVKEREASSYPVGNLSSAMSCRTSWPKRWLAPIPWSTKFLGTWEVSGEYGVPLTTIEDHILMNFQGSARRLLKFGGELWCCSVLSLPKTSWCLIILPFSPIHQLASPPFTSCLLSCNVTMQGHCGLWCWFHEYMVTDGTSLVVCHTL